MKLIKHYWMGIIIAFIYFLVLLFTLKDYGMHEDTPFHFLRGQAYLQTILTGDNQFSIDRNYSPVIFLPKQRISIYKPNASEEINDPIKLIAEEKTQLKNLYLDFQRKLNSRRSFYRSNFWTTAYWNTIFSSHPGVSDTFMAFFNRIFYEAIGAAGDIQAYFLYNIFVAALTIFFVFLFCQETFGKRVAFFSTIGLALYPYYFAESHFNIKDPIQMGFYAIAIISFYFWVKKNFKLRWFIIFVLATFLALGTKWNIFFLPLILIPWLFLLRKKSEVKNYLKLPKLIFFGLIATVTPFILLIMSWPFLWTNALYKLEQTFGFYSQIAVVDPRIEPSSFAPLPFGFDARAIVMFTSITPPLMLLLFLVGVILIFFKKIKEEYKAQWLLIIWFIVPFLRMIWAGSELYGSVRNYIEFLPAMAIIAGIGTNYFIDKITKILPWAKISLIAIFFTLYLTSFVLIIIKFHPNENIYFNFLIGGIKGAEKTGVYSWETSYDNGYYQAVSWFNKNAAKDAKLAYLDGTMIAISPLWLRNDIHFGSYFSGFERKGEYIISLVYPRPPVVFPYYYLDNFLDPVYEIKVDGVTLMKIWQNSDRYLKTQYKNERILNGKFQPKVFNQNTHKLWQIDFGKIEKITKLYLSYQTKGCHEGKVVWSFIKDNKETFFIPQISSSKIGKMEVFFPGFPVDAIRFLDISGDNCLYQSAIDKVYGLQ